MGNTPNVRFKGFTEDWEQRKFSDIAARESSISTSTTDVPSVEYEDVIAEEGRLNKDIHLKEAVKSGITFDGSQVLYGKLRPYLHNWLNPDFKGIAVGDWWVLKPINMDKKFLYRLIQTQQFDNIANQSSGSKMPRADWNLISNSEFMVPFSKAEQSKIGRYFDSLDHLITLHQQKCDETKEFKKYMLQNMFPQKDEKVPKIRFDGFTEDWEQRKFGDLGSVAMCKRVFKEQTTPVGEIPFYKIGTFGAEPDAFISRELFEEYKSKFQYPNVGDMLISASGTIGRTVEYSGEEAYFQDSNIVWFKHDDRIDNSFLRCIYNIVKWNGIEGSTIKRLYNDNFLKTEFYMPTTGEQAKIGAYFRSLDHLITLHQQKCNALKEFKKYMLQNMFPQKGENKCQN